MIENNQNPLGALVKAATKPLATAAEALESVADGASAAVDAVKDLPKAFEADAEVSADYEIHAAMSGKGGGQASFGNRTSRLGL